MYASTFLGFLPVSSTKLAEIKAAQTADNTCLRIVSFTKNECPAKDTLDDEIKKYLPIAAELNGSRIYFYADHASLSRQRFEAICSKEYTPVTTKCRARALESIWWPGLSDDMKRMVEQCVICRKERPNQLEPMIPTDSLPHPFHTIGMDLFEYK